MKGKKREQKRSEIIMANLEPKTKKFRVGCLNLFIIIAASTIIATGISVWAVFTFIFPDEFKPVRLSSIEKQELNAKLKQVKFFQISQNVTKDQQRMDENTPIEPGPYKENALSREFILTEREINALFMKNSELGKRLAVDLSEDLTSAKLLLPINEDIPFIGGKMLKVTAGLELACAEGRPIVVLKGVSIWGIPLPGSWLGNLKNVDLIKKYGDEGGFWETFSAGIEAIKVGEGSLCIRLKE